MKPPHTADSNEQAQLHKVDEFRQSFPGLFASFDSIVELRSQFKDHLIDLLLREIRGHQPAPRAWLARLGAALDATDPGREYLDRSSAFAQRLIEKLRGLIDLPTTLHPHEIDVLLAAVHLSAFGSRGADATPARSILRQVPDTEGWLEEAAVEVALLASAPLDMVAEEMYVGDVRCRFLATMLQLGEILDLDHASLTSRPLSQPALDADLRCWFAYYTRRIEVRRAGIVAFQMLVANSDGKEMERDLLARCRALTFEAEWHARRRILTANGVAVSRAPNSIASSAIVSPIPAELLPRLDASARDASNALPELLHLSDEPTGWPPLDALLPLPRSAVLADLLVRWEPGLSCSLQIWTADGARLVMSLAPSELGTAHIPADALVPLGSLFVWQLLEDLEGISSVVQSGEVWVLDAHERFRWDVASAINDPAALRSWRMTLGLWNDLLDEIWPRLVTNAASTQEAQAVYDVLLASYEWLREHAPESGRIDTIRNTAQTVYGSYLSRLAARRT